MYVPLGPPNTSVPLTLISQPSSEAQTTTDQNDQSNHTTESQQNSSGRQGGMYHSHQRRTRSLESVVSGGWVFYVPTTVHCPGLTNAYQNLLRGNIASGCSASVVRWFEDSFRICDEVCHRIDSLLPLGNYSPSYVQLYVGGPPEVLEHCMQDN